jgi:glutaminyl-peptide cyclotransferase
MIAAVMLAFLAMTGMMPAKAETRWTLVASHPHDPAAFTEGLLIHDGMVYESTGQVGKSEIRALRLTDGKVLRRVVVPPPYFGEGIALVPGPVDAMGKTTERIVSLTWRHGQGFVWNARDFAAQGRFSYSGEGWALTSDGNRLIMSDGTAELRFLDPVTFAETGRIAVHTADGKPVPMLNELEYIDGEVLANVWLTDNIARIDPVTGLVIDWIDLSPLVARARTLGAQGGDDVLNGIAWDTHTRRLYVTGKNWPRLFEIRLEK